MAGVEPWKGWDHGGGGAFVCQNAILERENTGESAAAGKPSLQPREANVQARARAQMRRAAPKDTARVEDTVSRALCTSQRESDFDKETTTIRYVFCDDSHTDGRNDIQTDGWNNN